MNTKDYIDGQRAHEQAVVDSAKPAITREQWNAGCAPGLEITEAELEQYPGIVSAAMRFIGLPVTFGDYAMDAVDAMEAKNRAFPAGHQGLGASPELTLAVKAAREADQQTVSVTYTVTVDFTESDERATLMTVRVASEAGEIGTLDNNACSPRDIMQWLGRAIIDDARNEFGIGR